MSLMHRVTASPRATVYVGGSPKNINRGMQPTSCNADGHGPRCVSGTARSPQPGIVCTRGAAHV
eukprot:7217691-Prymnesium_polylepis.1